MANITTNVEAQLTKIAAWQYLNAVHFCVSVAILIILLF
jgi:hypothetical protein